MDNIKKMILCGGVTFSFLAGCTNSEYLKESSISFKSSDSISSITQNKPEEDRTSSTQSSLNSQQSHLTQSISSQENSTYVSETGSGILADFANVAFMQLPIQFDKEGWIIQANGKYGFINANGEMIVEPKYSDLLHIPGGAYQDTIGYLYNSTYDWQNDAKLPNNYVASEAEVPMGFGMARGDSVFLDAQGNIMYCDPSGEKEIPVSSYVGTVQSGGIYTVLSYEDSRAKSDPIIADYYIYIPKYGYLEGPYAYKYQVSYPQMKSRSLDPTGYNHTIGSTVVLKDNNSQALYNLEQNAMITGFDWIRPIDYEHFAATKGNTLYMYSKDLDLLYKANVENGAGVIGNNTMIYDDGWKVVTLEYLAKNYPSSDDWMPSKISNVFSPKSAKTTSEGIQLTPGLYQTEVDLKVRTGPGLSFSQVSSKGANQIIHVQEIEVDDEGLVWGKLWDDRWVCLINQGQAYCSETSLDQLKVEDLSQAILDHYNWLIQPSGFYSVITDYHQNGPVWTGIVRYAMGEEEAKKREDMGLPVAANTYAFTVEINMWNGAISDENNLDSWNITQ